MRRPVAVALLLAFLLVGSVVGVAPAARATGYPVLPEVDEGRFLTNLSAPILSPGGSGALTFTVANPLAGPITAVVLTFELYGFNAFPGNATGPLPESGAPVFPGGAFNGSGDVIRIAQVGPGGSYSAPGNTSVTISVPSSAPSGTYAIRSSLAFSAGGKGYVLESRGFFSAALWSSATILPNGSRLPNGSLLPNGTPTLNLSRLGVSGVIPETALLVETNSVAPWLYGVLAASIVLAALGGYFAWRRGSRSSSGARKPPPPQKARTALGKRRRSEGD
jgi:hypothetical protein